MQHVPPNDARQRGEALDRRVALATPAAAQLQTVATFARFLIVVSRRRAVKTDGDRGVTWGGAGRG